MIRQAILASAVAGMTALTIAGPAFTHAAHANPPSPSPTGSPITPPSTPVPDTRLTVTVIPDKVEPGGTVNIKAVAPQGLVPAHAGAQSPVLDSDTLTTSGNVAAGTGHVRSDAKAGVYPVLVQAMTPDAVKLQGTTQITVVVVDTTPNPTPAVPRGGVGTGGGGGAGGSDMALLTAGSAIALLGVAAAVAAMRRRRADVRK